MQRKVLVIENSQQSLHIVSKLVRKAGLIPEGAGSLTEARARFSASVPEDYLCAVVAYSLPDAPHGEATDFTIKAFIPTIVVADNADTDTRNAILQRNIVDYLIKENHQIYDYLSRLLARLDKNKHIGVLVAGGPRAGRAEMVGLLRRHNFLVYEAKTLSQAQTQLVSTPSVRLMLVNYALDADQGIHYTAELRRAYSKEDLAIIGLLEGRHSDLSASFLKSGANDVLQSPYAQEEFLVRVMQNIELMESVENIRRLANADYLTGLPNRRHFFYTITTQYSVLPRPQSLALIDLDHFKHINDTYGHDAGDAVLKTVASLLSSLFDGTPLARFGGEEFCIYLPDITTTQASSLLQQFCARLADTPIVFNDQPLSVTASIGLFSSTTKSLEGLISEADKLLYQAKANGRNQLCAFAE
ncbi:diguanylate cyclase [Alteromonas sp. C1M14]|uniref:GGDEF domain-containing response regulator n=1 Tax=Alteromonas sp. C1M14 TaxID=2841567 RepID=UPI001C08E048|nr:diguanylate cyclase [Alteromonas sp. C1M14]MBU2980070.1 diguanylate cyclase [Alteromonas sp. C1M14]